MNEFDPGNYKEILIFLGTAGVAVPLFRRLKISPILGFLAAGVLLGPFGIGALANEVSWLSPLALNVAHIAPVAEFGVVFLLFMIGLELSWARLAVMRRLVFGLGALQVFGSAAALGAIALALDEPPNADTVAGFALALSSTAVVIPVLAETRRLGTAAGRTIFSVLLFQDLMVAPLLFMVSMLGAREGDFGVAIASTLLPAILGLAFVVLGGHLVLRPLFHHVAAARSTEFFMAACLLVVIGTGVFTAMFGLSMGLGAFIAGVLLAETEYRREIEVTIDPFKGLLLGLFFVSIGAELDLSQIYAAPLRTFGLAIGMMAVKFVVTWLAGRLMRLSPAVSTEAALLLAPGGEFAFIIITVAIGSNVLPADLGANLMIAVTLSMFAVPALGAIAQSLARSRAHAAPLGGAEPPASDSQEAPDAILVGYGRVGRLVGDMLRTHGLKFVAIETDAALVKRYRRDGIDIHWGNAVRSEFLVRCGVAKAKALIITMDKPAAAEEIVQTLRADYPHLTIVARARDAQHATQLYELGVTDAVPETIEASLQLSEAVLVDMGLPMGKVIASIHEKRDEFRKMLQTASSGADVRRAIRRSSRLKDPRRDSL
ncbi:cation:proton antiporter [Methylocapsa palsarum]|uniref:Monovalent cation:H+ antiporter-2, CPA2 family n=1 Tax=Methylocapsa palsarum TaxID=1612308 RepID=A0A1I3WZP7_9HYPH|nr:cation:proton antiporter [Methylocapsa palsarum]SFK12086.1 monovalent cation:H+ antiporter-2, CPA2 family [Methylocapsa palsarum]